MDINAASRRLKQRATPSHLRHKRLGSPDSSPVGQRPKVDPRSYESPDSGDELGGGYSGDEDVLVDMKHSPSGKIRSSSPSDWGGAGPSSSSTHGVHSPGGKLRASSPTADEFYDPGPTDWSKVDLAARDRSGRRLGGNIASRFYANQAIKREMDREKMRIAASAPKAIEERLREQRERAKRRKRVKSFLPNPRRSVRRFFEDPVTRFWCFCNICCTFCLWSGTFLFFQFLYPIWLRPIFNY